MPEPVERYEREADVQTALQRVWKAWVRGLDILSIDPAGLREQLDKHVRQIVWGVWVAGYYQLAEKFTKPSDEAAIAAAFLLFWKRWSDDLIARWVFRVRAWLTETMRAEEEEATQPNRRATAQPSTTATGAPSQPQPPAQPQQPPTAPPGGGKPPTPSVTTKPGTPVSLPVIPTTPAPDRPPPVVVPIEAPQLTESQKQYARDKWGKFREEVIGDHDIERESADAVTWGHSAAEFAAVEDVYAQEGEELVPFWITEKDTRVCPRCDPLDEQGPAVWMPVCLQETGTVDGPPLHPLCRCHLEWRPSV